MWRKTLFHLFSIPPSEPIRVTPKNQRSMNHSGEFTHPPPRIFKLEGRLLISALISILISLGGLSAYATSITLVVSEVLYDATGTEPDGEWIEIYNLGGLTIDLTHYKVGDEETFGGARECCNFRAVP